MSLGSASRSSSPPSLLRPLSDSGSFDAESAVREFRRPRVGAPRRAAADPGSRCSTRSANARAEGTTCSSLVDIDFENPELTSLFNDDFGYVSDVSSSRTPRAAAQTTSNPGPAHTSRPSRADTIRTLLHDPRLAGCLRPGLQQSGAARARQPAPRRRWDRRRAAPARSGAGTRRAARRRRERAGRSGSGARKAKRRVESSGGAGTDERPRAAGRGAGG